MNADNKTVCNLNTEILSGIGGKHCGEKEKMLATGICLLLEMFSKAFFLSVIQSYDCVIKS